LEISGPLVGLERVVHVHSTRVIDHYSGFAVDMIAIPVASLGERELDLKGVADALELEILRVAPDPVGSYLPHAISALLLSPPEGDQVAERFDHLMSTAPAEGLDIDPSVLSFASHCAYAEILGVEESPIRGKVLAAIVAAGGTVAVATIATISAPIVLVVGAGVAAGAGTIVIFSAAAAASERLYKVIAGS
jgi:hypothetical protein